MRTMRWIVISMGTLGAMAGIYGFAVKHDWMGLVYVAVCGFMIGVAWRARP